MTTGWIIIAAMAFVILFAVLAFWGRVLGLNRGLLGDGWGDDEYPISRHRKGELDE